MRALAVVASLWIGGVGCAESPSVAPLGDYTSWKRLDVTGEAPGHGDSYRVIYINDIAADPATPLYVGYPMGSVLVKEIRDDDGGTPGALRYLAIMRRTREIFTSLEDEGGWLFTTADAPGDEETSPSYCWRRCHVAAPYNGAWYDYRQ